MKQDGNSSKKKTHLIGFRVDEDVFNEVETRAVLAGKTTNDWCRDELLAMLNDDNPLTANEQMIHGQILRFGRMTLKVFDLLVNEQFTKENWQQVLATLNADQKEMAQKYFATVMTTIRKPRE
jgi:gamma-glutamylcyclotransferase (GGCT)/AIG2-like uncharacterized protein YtfP